jgi:hypothetical protein
MEDKKKVEELKRAIYEKLSPRRKKFIDKIGFENWDPFQEPKHPIEIRRDITKRTSSELIMEFMEGKDKVSLAYEMGLYEICMGLFKADEKYKAMFDFSIWYYNKLTSLGIDPEKAWEKR